MVQGAEHYNKYWHDWRCAAAPIFDSDNNPIASLTISSYTSLRDSTPLAMLENSSMPNAKKSITAIRNS